MINGPNLNNALLALSTTQSTLQHKTAFTHSHAHSSHWWQRLHGRCHLLFRSDNHSHRHSHINGTANLGSKANWEQSGVQFLSQGYFDMQTSGSRDWTTDFPISGRPLFLMRHSCPCVFPLLWWIWHTEIRMKAHLHCIYIPRVSKLILPFLVYVTVITAVLA